MSVTIRLAEGQADIMVVAKMWTEAASWLAEQGSNQWQYPVKMHNIKANVSADTCWIAEDNGQPVGTITVDTEADPGLWSGAELADAMIVHRMVVARSYAGRNIGTYLLQHAETLGRQLGKHWLRLDAWTSNRRLHSYYKQAGFRFVRVADSNLISAALFERPIPGLIEQHKNEAQ